jgi:hypothetical protein
MTCATPISSERLVAYWADDLDVAEIAAIDEHVFACDACARESERLGHIAQIMRTRTPPIVTRADVEALRAKGLVVRENEFRPGVRATATFQQGDDILIHRLVGIDLEGAERVDVVVRSESGGPIANDMFVPFDVARGEVLIACQRHFQAMGSPDVAFDISVKRAGGPPTILTYFIPHQFV